MTTHNISARVCVLLACIAPLTPRQLAIALDYNDRHLGPQLAAMWRGGRLQRATPSARQRQASGGRSGAYSLAER